MEGVLLIDITSEGSFDNTDAFLEKMERLDLHAQLVRSAMDGLAALRAATPVDTGTTSESWGFEVLKKGDDYIIQWLNTNVNKGVTIAIILQYGHGTGTGGYVAGRDYINPAMRPVFDRIAEDVWKVVTSA